MTMQDVMERFALTLFGWLLVVLAFAWAGFDAYSHAGRVGMTTLFGALAIASAGGVLVSKHKTLELYDFLFDQAKRFSTVKISLPSAGSDNEK